MNNIPLIMDANNRFYAGMTLAEAKRYRRDKSFWNRDFHNLDKDGNGVLSVNEIMNERKRTSNINKIIGSVAAGWGVFDIITYKGSKLWQAIDLAFDAFIAYSCLSKAVKTDKKTKEYEALIQANNINRYA